MTTTRRTSRAKAPAAPVIPQDVRTKKAKKLPMFGPGIVISVPLSLLPEYLKLYDLEPQGMQRGILMVKRVPNEGKQV